MVLLPLSLLLGWASATTYPVADFNAAEMERFGDIFHLANEVKNRNIRDGDFIGRDWDVQNVLEGPRGFMGLSGRGLLARNDRLRRCGVAIQGTDFKKSPKDIIRDMDTSAVPLELHEEDRSFMWIHQGFRKRFNELIGPESASQGDVRQGGNHGIYNKFLQQCCRDGYTITFTGHSLGGAVAWIAGSSLFYNINPRFKTRFCRADKLEVVTFGQPRVKAGFFGQKCPRDVIPTTRFVNVKGSGSCQVDVVPQIPMCASFCEGAHYLIPPTNGRWNMPTVDSNLKAPHWGVPNAKLHSRKRYYENLMAGRDHPEFEMHKGECEFTGARATDKGSLSDSDCELRCRQSGACVAYSLAGSPSAPKKACKTYDKVAGTHFTADWNPAKAPITAGGTYCYRRTIPGEHDTADDPDQWETDAEREPEQECSGAASSSAGPGHHAPGSPRGVAKAFDAPDWNVGGGFNGGFNLNNNGFEAGGGVGANAGVDFGPIQANVGGGVGGGFKIPFMAKTADYLEANPEAALLNNEVYWEQLKNKYVAKVRDGGEALAEAMAELLAEVQGELDAEHHETAKAAVQTAVHHWRKEVAMPAGFGGPHMFHEEESSGLRRRLLGGGPGKGPKFDLGPAGGGEETCSTKKLKEAPQPSIK